MRKKGYKKSIGKKKLISTNFSERANIQYWIFFTTVFKLSFCHFEELGFVLCSARFVSSFVRLCNYTCTTVAVSSIQNSGKHYKQRGVARYSNLHPHTQYTYLYTINRDRRNSLDYIGTKQAMAAAVSCLLAV